MQLFFLLFLVVVLLFTNNNALRCVNHTDPLFFNTFYPLTPTKAFVDNLNTTDGYKSCSIVYQVQHPRRTFAVKFNSDDILFSGNVNTDVSVVVDFTMSVNEFTINPASGLIQFVFLCDNEDACERQFWRDHIDWLFKEEFTILEAAFRSILIMENAKAGQCIYQNQTDTGICSSIACSSFHNSMLNETIRACVDESRRPTRVQLAVIISFATDTNAEENHNNNPYLETSILALNYECVFDNCNDQEIENKLRKAFKNHFNLSTMYEVLKTKFHENQSTQSSTGSMIYSTTSQSPKASIYSTTNQSPNASIYSTTSQSPNASIHSTTSQSPNATIYLTTSQPPNASILHFISINILIYPILFLVFF